MTSSAPATVAPALDASDIYDAYFDPEAGLVQVPFNGPGYHSRVPTGTPVHPTNTSLCYALELVCRNDADADRRAASIVRKILPLQDRRPLSKTYGIWPWVVEEPLSEMAPPDWNWADFCGFRVAQIELRAGARLPVDLRTEMREALFHAAGSIYRRNVGAHYTNICVMGGIVTALAGEILGEERMLDYGRQRLAEVVATHRAAGGFPEYNSPTYTRVVLWDCEQALRCVQDTGALESLAYLYRSAWKTVAEHYHPATGQWAGPHSRDYTLFMTRELACYLAYKTGVALHENPAAPRSMAVSPLVGWIVERLGTSATEARSAVIFDEQAPACPPEWVERFQRLPEPEYEIRERYIQREPDTASTWGTTWMHEEACLGSVNRDFFMDQRRAVLAFWNDAARAPVVLRLRFMHDGREFASACVSNAQRGPRVLSAVHLLLGQGDFHPILDVPADSTFSAEDFRLRYELTGDDISVCEGGDGTFRLSAGDWEAIVTPSPGSFAGAAVEWKITRGQGWVAVDAVCYAGPKRAFPFADLPPTILAAGLRLQRKGEPFTRDPIEYVEQSGSIHFRHGDLEVSTPGRATTLF